MKYGGDDDVSTVSKVPFEKFLLEFSTRKRAVSLKKNEDQRSLCCLLLLWLFGSSEPNLMLSRVVLA